MPATDPAVERAARFVRLTVPASPLTYEISLALLFLSRLGDVADESLVRRLALRLAAGQTHLGGWGYNCPLLTAAQEKKLLTTLRQKTARDLPTKVVPPMRRGEKEQADNSNTQFAILALWVARKYELPLDYTLAYVELRFRASQRSSGWHYNWIHVDRGSGSMTCAGLLGLAVGRGSALASAAEHQATRPDPQDQGFASGLRALALYLNDPSDMGAITAAGPKGALNLYFLWSVARVGVLCNLETIGARDWYRWGVDLILATQRPNGSWVGRGSGGYSVADTCFALLFLKRADLLPDLRVALKKRLTITDPGLGRAIGKKGLPSKGSSRDSLGSMSSPGDDVPLTANLGEVPAKQTSNHPLRVRGPGSFKITAIRAGDAQLRISNDSLKREVHELTVTLHPDKSGDFERTIYLETDIPGRPEIAVRIRARAKGPSKK